MRGLFGFGTINMPPLWGSGDLGYVWIDKRFAPLGSECGGGWDATNMPPGWSWGIGFTLGAINVSFRWGSGDGVALGNKYRQELEVALPPETWTPFRESEKKRQ